MNTKPYIVGMFLTSISVGCFGLSIGESHNYTVPTKAQELRELNDALAANKITQQEYELAKNAVFNNQPMSTSTMSAISWTNHADSK